MRILFINIIKSIERAYLIPWEKGSLLLSSCILFFLISVVAIPAVYIHRKMGSDLTSYFLLLYIIPVLYAGWYSILRKRMNHLRASLPSNFVHIADGLYVHGIIQSPAIVLIADEQLIFVPLLGKRIMIPLSDVKIIKETSWYNGAWYPGQTGFWLETPLNTRLGFIVPDSGRWRSLLQQ